MVVVFAGVFAALSGNLTLVFAAVVLAGLMQIGFGLLRFGQYIRLVPYPVISGFMSGIGCIIIALQFPRLFGHESGGSGTIAALMAVPDAVLKPNWPALTVGLLTLAIVFYWPKAWGRWVPSPLAALVTCTLFSLAIPGAPILGDIPTGFPAFLMPELSRASFALVLEAAFILAILAAIDSLLTSLVADEQLTAFQQELPRTTSAAERALLEAGDGRVTLFDFNGPLSFGAAADLEHHVRERVKARASAIVLDFSGTNGIDVSAASAVETIACDARLAGRKVYVCGMNSQVRSVLTALNADHCLPPDAYYDSRLDALRAAVAAAVPDTTDTGGQAAAG